METMQICTCIYNSKINLLRKNTFLRYIDRKIKGYNEYRFIDVTNGFIMKMNNMYCITSTTQSTSMNVYITFSFNGFNEYR